jgi:hypothetical protein
VKYVVTGWEMRSLVLFADPFWSSIIDTTDDTTEFLPCGALFCEFQILISSFSPLSSSFLPLPS